MPTSYKVLGQVIPAANTDADAYTVPASTQAIISTLAVCNQGQAATTFRVAVRPAGVAIAARHYVCFDSPVAGNDMVGLTLGITLGAGDVITVRAGTTTVSFNVFGSEITP